MSTTSFLLFDTRRAAHERVKPKQAAMEAQVLADVIAQGNHGATADEIAQRFGRSVLSVRPRVSELAKRGQLVATDRTRQTPLGSPATVYVAARFAPTRSQPIDLEISIEDRQRQRAEDRRRRQQ